MPKVVLEFEVTDKGLAGVPRLLTETESALRRVGKAGAEMAQGTERTNVSLRDTRQAIGALSMAFGEVNPAITTGALQLSQFTQGLRGTSLSTKAMTVGLVAAGGAIAGFVAAARQSEEVAERFAAIDLAVKSLDFGAVRQGIGQTTIELAKADRMMSTWAGTAMTAAQNAGVTFLNLFGAQIPNSIEASNQAVAKLRAGLEQLVAIQMRAQEAVFSGQMAGLQMAGGGKAFQALLGRGLVSESMVGAHAEGIRDLVRTQFTSALAILDEERKKAFAEASARGTLDIESAAINQQYLQAVQRARTELHVKLFDVEEQARQQAQTVRGQRESTRAFGAGLAQEKQAARLKAMQADLEAAKKIQAENDAFLKKIGVPAWMLPGVDPRAKQFIEEQKNTLIMGIDETLQKNLSAINQLKTTEEERQRLARTANETASIQRKQANEDAIREINEMYDAAAKLRDELWKAGEAVRLGLSASLDEALGKIRAGALQIGGMGAGAGAGAGTGATRPEPTKPWGGEGKEPGSPGGPPPWSTTGGGGGDVGGPVYVGPPGQVPTWETPPAFKHGGFVPRFQHGGIVDFSGFPVGSAAHGMPSGFAPMRPWGPQNAIDRVYPGMTGGVPIIAEPGELILNQAQQGNLAGKMMGGGDIVITVLLESEAIIRAVRIPLNQAIAYGRITIRG